MDRIHGVLIMSVWLFEDYNRSLSKLNLDLRVRDDSQLQITHENKELLDWLALATPISPHVIHLPIKSENLSEPNIF